ncbi:kinase-like domain-containing protein [Mycena floridula]|nr:kinase-like domain-containing protein [Mycena floridula]
MVRPSTDSFPDLTGQFLDNDRYELLSVIGIGGYGKVYEALDTHTSTSVAIKCLAKPELSSREELRLNRELALHKKVSSHPNIVTLHTHFTSGDFIYVVLDLCAGGDLFTAVNTRDFFKHKDDLIKTIMMQLIDAVEYCHQSNVFHRDLKPENVLLSTDGTTIYLADFGLSSDQDFESDFGCGSSYYMSPECVGTETGRKPYSTVHNDIWSIGIVLTNILSDVNPWRLPVSYDLSYARFLRDPDSLRQNLSISEDAALVFRGVFRRNPIDRPTLDDFRKQILAVQTFFGTSLARSASTARRLPAALASSDIGGVLDGFVPHTPVAKFPAPPTPVVKLPAPTQMKQTSISQGPKKRNVLNLSIVIPQPPGPGPSAADKTPPKRKRAVRPVLVKRESKSSCCQN